MARKGGSKVLKRYAAPPVMQVFSVKERRFTTRPEPGPHSLEMSLPLQVLVRDILKMAETGREAKYLISRSMVLVDGVVRASHRFPVGLMDVVSVKELGKHYRLLLNEKGRLTPVEIPPEEAAMKICRINKKYLYKGGLRLATEDGRTFETDDWSLNIGGSLLVRVPEGVILDKAPLAEGSIGYVFMGKHTGAMGVVKKLYKSSLLGEGVVTLAFEDGREVNTVREYVMVVGRDKPWLKLF